MYASISLNLVVLLIEVHSLQLCSGELCNHTQLPGGSAIDIPKCRLMITLPFLIGFPQTATMYPASCLTYRVTKFNSVPFESYTEALVLKGHAQNSFTLTA